MYHVYRIEDGLETLIGVASTPGEAAEQIEQDKQWLGREASYRWAFAETPNEEKNGTVDEAV